MNNTAKGLFTVLFVLITYMVAAASLFPFFGFQIFTLYIIFVVVAAIFHGKTVGITCGLLGILINSFIASLCGLPIFDVMPNRSFLLGHAIATFVGAVMGIVNDMVKKARRMEIMLESLHEHAFKLSKTRSERRVAEISFDAIEDVLGFNLGSFLIVEDDRLRTIYTCGLETDHIPDLPLDGLGVTVRAVKTGETQLVPYTERDKDYIWPLDSQPCKSEIAVPVKIDEKVVAVINLESREPNAFSEEDKRVLELLALHVSSAISRIRQVEILKSIVSEKTRRLAEHTARLERLSRMKDRFISVATHELRTPLVSIKGYLDLILSGRAGDVLLRILDLLRVVERNAERLRRLTDDLLDVQRIESGRLQLSCEPLDLREVIR